MGATITALSDSRIALQRHLTLVVYTTLVAVATMIVAFLLTAVGLVIPILPQFVVSILVVPVGLTAIVGMVYAGVNGESPVDGATRALEEYGLSLIGAHAIYQFAVFGLSLVLTVLVAFTVGLGTLSAGAGGTGDPSAAAGSLFAGGASVFLLALAVLAGLVMVVAAFIVQFLDVAVVLSGSGAVEAYRTVVQFVIDAPLSVLGYTVMRGLVVVLGVGAPLVVVGGALTTAGVGDLATVAVLGLLALLVLPFVAAFLAVYHDAYYQRRRRAPIV